jgi:DNA-binding HxlR family transcriptional regulator
LISKEKLYKLTEKEIDLIPVPEKITLWRERFHEVYTFAKKPAKVVRNIGWQS